jgi:hypothetical protein
MQKFILLTGCLLLAGCSSVKLPDLGSQPPTAKGIERYGGWCEQLGNARGSPAWEKCVRKQEDTYQ